jgi:hypothetical protein
VSADPAWSPATYSTPAGWLQRCTLRDDTAEHQIRIDGSHPLYVSCTCRRTGTASAAGIHCEPIAPIRDIDGAWAAWLQYHEDQL